MKSALALLAARGLATDGLRKTAAQNLRQIANGLWTQFGGCGVVGTQPVANESDEDQTRHTAEDSTEDSVGPRMPAHGLGA